MAGLDDLAPAERAKLLGKPDGEAGLALAEWMNDFNRPFIEASRNCLRLKDRHRLLEIGFGNGHHVTDLLARGQALEYVGVDISATMVEEAARFNHPLVATGQARFQLGNVGALPFAPASFDRAIAINVIYFWPEPVRPLTEIRRVLCPDGISVIGASDPSSQKAAYAREEYGFHPRDASILIAQHRQAGFRHVEVETAEHTVTALDGTPLSRRFNIVIARP
jgi:SAM-dependent methyltransferase